MGQTVVSRSLLEFSRKWAGSQPTLQRGVHQVDELVAVKTSRRVRDGCLARHELSGLNATFEIPNQLPDTALSSLSAWEPLRMESILPLLRHLDQYPPCPSPQPGQGDSSLCSGQNPFVSGRPQPSQEEVRFEFRLQARILPACSGKTGGPNNIQVQIHAAREGARMRLE